MRLRLPRRLEGLLCAGLLTVLPVVMFYPVLFERQIPFENASTLENGPSTPATAAEIGLLSKRYFPWYNFLGRTLSSGQLPLWHAGESAGFPFFAVWESRCLSPFSIPFYLLPAHRAYALVFFLKLIVAGWCAYYTARRLGFHAPLALMPATAFQFSGLLVLWHGYPITDVMPFFPLLIVFVERQMLGQTRFWPMGALIFAFLLFGGDPWMVAAIVALTLLVVGAHAVQDRIGRVRPRWSLSGLGFGLGAGLALAAVQILPHIEYLGQATAPPPATVALTPDMAGLCAALFGQAADHVSTPFAYSPDLMRVLTAFHAGVVPILLTVLWLSVRWATVPAKRRRIESWWYASILLSAGGWLCMRGFRGSAASGYWAAPYYLFANGFIWSLLGAAAADTWLSLNPFECRKTLKRLVALTLPVMVLSVLLLWAGRANGVFKPAPGLELALPTLLIGAAFAAVLGYTLFRPGVSVFGYAMALLIVCDLWLTHNPLLTFVASKQLYPETPLIQTLTAQEGRIAGAARLASLPLDLWGIDALPSASGIRLARTESFLDKAEDTPLLFRRAAVKAYVLDGNDISGPYAGLRARLRLRNVIPSGSGLFTDPEARTRAWMSFEGRPIERFDAAGLSPHLPPLMETSVGPPPTAGESYAPATVVRSTGTRVAVRVESGRPGVLVLADAWYPGWQAAVDGVPAVVFPVDGMFRGVSIEEGQHEVVFHYRPAWLRWGAAISIVAALGVGLGLVYMVLASATQWLART